MMCMPSNMQVGSGEQQDLSIVQMTIAINPSMLRFATATVQDNGAMVQIPKIKSVFFCMPVGGYEAISAPYC